MANDPIEEIDLTKFPPDWMALQEDIAQKLGEVMNGYLMPARGDLGKTQFIVGGFLGAAVSCAIALGFTGDQIRQAVDLTITMLTAQKGQKGA